MHAIDEGNVFVCLNVLCTYRECYCLLLPVISLLLRFVLGLSFVAQLFRFSIQLLVFIPHLPIHLTFPRFLDMCLSTGVTASTMILTSYSAF